MTTSLEALGRALIVTPVYLAALVLLIRRRRWPVVLAALLPPLTVAVVALTHEPVTVGPTAVLLGVVGLAILPRRLNPWETCALFSTVVGGLVLKWLTITSPVTLQWLHAVHP